MSTVECDRAFLADGGEISIEDATSGANGYFCLGCGQELMARKGKVNDPHFAHLPAGGTGSRPCDYSSETYRHDLAKKLLRQLKKVRVPAVYAACPPNFHGRLPRLAEAQDVEAAIVLDERNVYLDEQGEIRFARRHRTEPFDDHRGQRVLLGRPDVIFLDAQRRPILLIEIYATHKVSEEKISRLYTLGVDAIEIFVPAHFDPVAIKKLFSVTSHTHWLYNGQQADYRFLASDSHVLANGGAPAAELEGRLSGRRETLKCRRSRVGHALRGVRNCLGRPDIEAIQGEVRTAQATGEAFTERLESERDKRDERLGAAVRARVAERRKANANQTRELAEQETTLSEAERELARRISADEEQLSQLALDLTSRIKRAEDTAESEYIGQVDAIQLERERRRNELSRIGREAAAVVSATARFSPARTELERQEGILARAAATNRRGLERAAADLRKIEQATERIDEQTAELRRIESKIA
ncbi:hypothetical protein HHL22_23420 [Hymenobacter sp. RP-2-7]|uniref:Competence protein CoiA-like N-terminal domain-containing protein n=1 Tax=Hymenobacter polaris TaxID=2682546 RepID=A0A7Y0FQ20_9BACT|nr:competence protein CoiA family protein [Hymenobacter polaris]NML68161.1 hypothetical protein [Hymenobacter polaris]